MCSIGEKWEQNQQHQGIELYQSYHSFLIFFQSRSTQLEGEMAKEKAKVANGREEGFTRKKEKHVKDRYRQVSEMLFKPFPHCYTL